MDKSEFEELRTDFLRHEAICEERWKTVFNEIREAKEESKDRWAEVKASFASIQKMVLGASGAFILFLLAIIFEGML